MARVREVVELPLVVCTGRLRSVFQTWSTPRVWNRDYTKATILRCLPPALARFTRTMTAGLPKTVLTRPIRQRSQTPVRWPVPACESGTACQRWRLDTQGL